MMMMRKTEHGLEISGRAISLLFGVFSILNAIFVAGAAWKGTQMALAQKVDRVEFADHVRWADQQSILLHLADSLQQDGLRQSVERIRDIVCATQTTKACR